MVVKNATWAGLGNRKAILVWFSKVKEPSRSIKAPPVKVDLFLKSWQSVAGFQVANLAPRAPYVQAISAP